jgi:alpha-beta hydrolase superfamily lysophospholipase
MEFEMITTDGLKLWGRTREPETNTRAVVCLVHGIGEHSGRYDHVAEAFNSAGYAMLAFDLRGHGKSEGKRGHVPDYDVLMDDISLLLKRAKDRYPELPVFFYGHSLGGNIVIHHALLRRPELAGIIATAPLLRLAFTPPKWKTGLLHVMYTLRVSCAVSRGTDDTKLSHDLNVVRAYRNDPLTHDRITPNLAISMLRAGEWNLAHAAELPCPLLLMHGTDDRITSPAASREFADRAGSPCTVKIWEGFYHELHNESGQREVFADMLKWMDAYS